MKYSDLEEILKYEPITDFAVINKTNFPIFEEITKELPRELNYIKRPERKTLTLFYPSAKSVLICLYQYWNSEKNYEEEFKKLTDIKEHIKKRTQNWENIEKKLKNGFKISRYALVEEYHKKIKEHLRKIITKLKEKQKEIDGKIFVDTSPIFEKKLSETAGLGFIGKNTLLISPVYGSYLFIGGIILNEEFENIPEIKEKKERICDSCRICEESCPTKALYNESLEPEKCISFWTTHTKREIPEQISSASDYILGCDICQEFCPYNKTAKKGKSIF